MCLDFPVATSCGLIHYTGQVLVLLIGKAPIGGVNLQAICLGGVDHTVRSARVWNAEDTDPMYPLAWSYCLLLVLHLYHLPSSDVYAGGLASCGGQFCCPLKDCCQDFSLRGQNSIHQE